jgi:hypothetical protein
MSSEQRPDRASRPASKRAMTRAADRHYLAVVAAEARRLGRQLRPSPPGATTANPTLGKHSSPQGAH